MTHVTHVIFRNKGMNDSFTCASHGPYLPFRHQRYHLPLRKDLIHHYSLKHAESWDGFLTQLDRSKQFQNSRLRCHLCYLASWCELS